MTNSEPGTAEIVGTLLGSYRVVERLGEGGMGVVYLGRHEKLGHRAAVKVLQHELSRNADTVQRFFNEAQATTSIRNLGIVHIFDYGTTADGRAYFVMEFLEGQSLGARLARRRLTYVECCRLGRQIANVLYSAHTVGITHRDLKPDNLFLIPDAEVVGGERVKVLDFGIAKLASDTHASGVKTRTGLMMGTPQYMSPEQGRGAATVDPRSDIYSLGCILFEMACGRPPFVGEGLGDVLGAHQYLAPPAPQSLAPDLPVELATLIVHMLAKQPEARPPTMAVVGQALEEILRTLDGSPARAPTTPPIQRRAPTPLPIPELAPPSTTLGSSAGSTSPAPRASGHQLRFVLGGFAAVIALSAIIAVLTTEEEAPPEPRLASAPMIASPPPEETAAISLDAAATTPSPPLPSPPPAPAVAAPAPNQPPPPPPLSPAPAVAAPDPPAATTELPSIPPDAAQATAPSRTEIESECRRHQKNQSWSALRACADQLKRFHAALANELEIRATKEIQAALRITAVEAALRENNLNRARAELDQVWTGSSGYQKITAMYAAAEEATVAAMVARLERVNSGDCQEYIRILAQEAASGSSRVAAESQRRVKCVVEASPPKCDANALSRQGMELVVAGRRAAAIAAYEAAHACKPEPHYLRSALVLACQMGDVIRARAFWKRLSPDKRQASVGECVRNRITERELNLP